MNNVLAITIDMSIALTMLKTLAWQRVAGDFGKDHCREVGVWAASPRPHCRRPKAAAVRGTATSVDD